MKKPKKIKNPNAHNFQIKDKLEKHGIKMDVILDLYQRAGEVKYTQFYRHDTKHGKVRVQHSERVLEIFGTTYKFKLVQDASYTSKAILLFKSKSFEYKIFLTFHSWYSRHERIKHLLICKDATGEDHILCVIADEDDFRVTGRFTDIEDELMWLKMYIAK
jgi:hypothetical protein